MTWHIIRRHYYQIAASQWRMVHVGTTRVSPIHTSNVGPINEGFTSISDIINPLFATGWRYGHAHFWEFVLVFFVQSYQKYISQLIRITVSRKSRLHRCAERRAHDSRGGGGPRQVHHFNVLLPSHVALARHTSEEIILNIVLLHAVMKNVISKPVG